MSDRLMVGPVPNQTLFSGKSVPGSLHSCLFLRYYHIHDPIQSVRLTWCLAGFDLSGNCRRHWRKCGKTAGRPYVSDEPLRRRLPGSSADTDGRDTDRNEYREPPAPPAGAPASYLLYLLSVFLPVSFEKCFSNRAAVFFIRAAAFCISKVRTPAE
jgi:hypothetical protein